MTIGCLTPSVAKALVRRAPRTRLWVWTALLTIGFTARLVAGERATAVATVTAGFVTGITVTSSGSGYVVEPVVTVSGGGGRGATGKAVLSGDAVGLVIVLTAGSGYTSSPTVTIEEPPKDTTLSVRLVPALKVDGAPGSTSTLEWSQAVDGPWTVWTNVVVGSDGVTVVDLAASASARFYRVSGARFPFPPPGMALVPAGTFTMGDIVDGDSNAKPVTARVSAFYMDTNLVSFAAWRSVYAYATARGYNFVHSGDGKATNHPVQTVNWWDTVKWCNARSQQAGLTPVYYTDEAYTQVYISPATSAI